MYLWLKSEMEESYWWALPKTVKNYRNLLKIEVLCWLWYTSYALLFTNLSLSHLWYSSLVFNISKLLKASDYFAKVYCQNYDIFWTCITFRTTAKISEPLKIFWYIIHLEILSFFYWCSGLTKLLLLVLLITLSQYLLFIHIIHINHWMRISL